MTQPPNPHQELADGLQNIQEILERLQQLPVVTTLNMSRTLHRMLLEVNNLIRQHMRVTTLQV